MTPTISGPSPEPTTEPRGNDTAALRAAVDLARGAAAEEGGEDRVGEYLGEQPEDGALTHLFAAAIPGYRGWRWAVTVAGSVPDAPVTISEVVLLPGPDALVGPRWVPWEERVRAGDLGVGDLMPAGAEDDRLVPGYLGSDDPAVEEVTAELGLGRVRVMSLWGRMQTARRWHDGERGPRSDMARSAPATCGTCGFYLPLAGSLRAAFGACGNEISPADGQVVHAEYGCGAHSEAEVDAGPAVPVTEMVYDDTNLDVEPKPAASGDRPGADRAGSDGAGSDGAGGQAGS